MAILGLSYKKDTNSIKNAPSLILLSQLKSKSVIVYDPVVDVNNIAPWCEKANNPEEAILKSDILIILTPWEQILKIDLKWVSENMNNKYFIDPFNLFNKRRIDHLGMKYFSIGMKI